jgi:hypothetical protein
MPSMTSTRIDFCCCFVPHLICFTPDVSAHAVKPDSINGDRDPLATETIGGLFTLLSIHSLHPNDDEVD